MQRKLTSSVQFYTIIDTYTLCSCKIIHSVRKIMREKVISSLLYRKAAPRLRALLRTANEGRS